MLPRRCRLAALISFLDSRRRRRLLASQTGLRSLSAMDWREFEMLVGEAFRRQGYNVREIGLGVGPQEALQHLVRRVNSDDLELLVTAILVQFEIGGNLSRILDSIANTIRAIKAAIPEMYVIAIAYKMSLIHLDRFCSRGCKLSLFLTMKEDHSPVTPSIA